MINIHQVLNQPLMIEMQKGAFDDSPVNIYFCRRPLQKKCSLENIATMSIFLSVSC